MLQTGALLVSVLQNRTCALNKQFPQITVAALADAEKLLLASGGVFAGDQPYPRCELAALAECSTISDRGDVMPRSSNRPRIWFTTAVRRMIQRSRTRCRDCISNCSSVLIGTSASRGGSLLRQSPLRR